MFDGPRRRTSAAAAAALRGRFERLAREWLPPPATGVADASHEPLTVPVDPAAWDRLLASTTVEVDGTEQRARRRSVILDGWTPSALRGLMILIAVAGVFVAWWWWSGRPVAVAVAPTVIATGPAAAIADSDRPVESPSPPTAPSAEPRPVASPTAATVVVHVAGLVARPGLVTLTAGARVADAIAAAGGVTRPRAAESVNLARLVSDGEQIVVALNARPPADPGVPMSAAAPQAQLDLNTASTAQLEDLPGVGPVLAQRIAAWRADNGPFRSVDELGEVSGIGDATLAELRPLVRV